MQTKTKSAQIFTENRIFWCTHHIGESELKNDFLGHNTSSKNNFLANIFTILKPILFLEADVREEQKSRLLKLIFNVVSKYVIVFSDSVLGRHPTRHRFQKVKIRKTAKMRFT